MLLPKHPMPRGTADQEIQVAVQQLFDTWSRALRADDAALFRSILTSELAESCELDEFAVVARPRRRIPRRSYGGRSVSGRDRPHTGLCWKSPLVSTPDGLKSSYSFRGPWRWKTENGGQDFLWASPRIDARTSHRLHHRVRTAGSANTRRSLGLTWNGARRFLL